MIRLDASAASVVATCTECPSWRIVRGDRITARIAAADHDRRVHARHEAAEALARSIRRRAARTPDPFGPAA